MTSLILTADRIGLSFLTDWFEKLEAKRNRRAEIKRTTRELEQLSDAELRDIGINRSMISSVALESHFDNRSA